MSLQVWLPLNGVLENNGLSNLAVTNSGASINTSGKIGSCYSFDGSDDYIELSSADLYPIFSGGSQPFSIAFWIYHADSTRAIIFGDYSLTGTIGFNIELTTAHQFRFYWNGTPDKNFDSNSSVGDSTWTHLCVTYDGSKICLYKNGSVISDVYSGTLASRTKTSGSFYLGRDSRTGATALNGRLNDFRIYDHCLTEKEVKEISKGLVLHYKFDHDGLGNENLVSGVLDGLPVVTTRTDGRWCNLSGGNASVSVAEDNTAYIGNYVYKIVGNTSGNKDVSQYNTANPFSLVSGNTYTMSAYYRGSGKMLIRIWDATSGSQLVGGSQNFDTNGAWERISYTFTATSAMASGHNLGFLFGITGIGTTDICGMKVEAGSVATAWSPSSIETYWESYSNVIRDSSGFGNDGVIVGNSSYVLDSPRYDMSFYMSNSSTSNHVEVSNAFTFDNSKVSVSFWTNATKSRNQVIFADKNLVIEFAFLNSVAFLYPTSSKSGFSLANYTSGQWNHIVAIKNGSTYSLYVNGQLASSSGSNYYVHKAEQMWILNRSYNNTYAAIAGISDFRVYSTILSGDDVLELYHTSASVDHDGSVYAREIVEA